MERVIGYTESFFLSAMQFISECAAKDTADDTELPDIEALVEDALFFGSDEDGLCFNLTDNYDSDRPFVCTVIDYGEGIILDAA
jgi:hypothetical protein